MLKINECSIAAKVFEAPAFNENEVSRHWCATVGFSIISMNIPIKVFSGEKNKR